MKTMAEVLAEHGVAGMSGGTHLACRCNRTWVPHAEYRDHLEAALSAAGFGLVADAKAEALREAAEALEEDASRSSYTDPEEVTQGQLDAAEWLRARDPS